MLHGVVHYCVANMPGAVAQTSTFALTNATIGFGIKLADLGVVEAVHRDRALALGVNTFNGHCTYKAVAEALEFDYVPLDKALATKR
jgi:alanine dehydrogenase